MKKLITLSTAALILISNAEKAPACWPEITCLPLHDQYTLLNRQVSSHTSKKCTCRDYDWWDDGECRIEELKEHLDNMEDMMIIFKFKKILDEYDRTGFKMKRNLF